MFKSTKTYGPEVGLSAVFRQWRAQSHCAKLHGYALSFKFIFACDRTDMNGWVMDFGQLKGLKAWLVDTFDHKLLVADDDPKRFKLLSLSQLGLADVLTVHGTGCEAFAEHAFYFASGLVSTITDDRVWVEAVECREHGANSAIYIKD